MSNSTAADFGSYSTQGCLATDWTFGFVSVLTNLFLVFYINRILKARKTLDVPNMIRVVVLVNFVWHFANFVYVEWLAETTMGVAASWVIAVVIATVGIAVGTFAKAEFVAAFVGMFLFSQGWLPLLASLPISFFVGLVVSIFLTKSHMVDVGSLLLVCVAIGFNITIGGIGLFANIFRPSSAPSRCLDEHINIIFVCNADCDVVTTNDDVVNRVSYTLGALGGSVFFFIWLYVQIVCNNVPANSKTADYQKRSCLYRTCCCCCKKNAQLNNFSKLADGYNVPQVEVAESVPVGGANRGNGGSGSSKKNKNKKTKKREKSELEKFEEDLGVERLDDIRQEQQQFVIEDEEESENEQDKIDKVDAKQASIPVLNATPALLAPQPANPLPPPPSQSVAIEVKAESKREEQPLSA
jgi:hypothetical protein